MASIANDIAEICYYAHNKSFGDGEYGQNIGAGYPPDRTPGMITNDMYNREIELYPGYGIEPPEGGEGYGHFTQMVWKNTSQVGCATVKCDTLGNTGEGVQPYFTVCNYYPPGESTLVPQLVQMTYFR